MSDKPLIHVAKERNDILGYVHLMDNGSAAQEPMFVDDGSAVDSIDTSLEGSDEESSDSEAEFEG